MTLTENINRIELKPLDSSYHDNRYLVTIDNRNYSVSENMGKLLLLIKDSSNLADAHSRYCSETGSCIAFNEFVERIQESTNTFFKENNKSDKTFIYDFTLIDADKCNTIALFLRNLHVPILKYSFLLLYVVLSIFFFANYISYLKICLSDSSLYSLLAALGAIIAITLMHEFGHLSASQYHCIKTGKIGVGLYIGLIVLFADVSNSWKLNRKQRLDINFGGVYFQAVCLIPLYLLFFNTENHILAYILLATNIGILFVLNPFFKFDGYWVLSDIIGVPNLRKGSLEMLFYILSKKGKYLGELPSFLRLPNKTRMFALIYMWSWFIFMAFIFLWVLPTAIIEFVSEVPNIYATIQSYLSAGEMPHNAIYYILPKILFCILLIIWILRKLKSIIVICNKSVKPS
ncbi:MAG: hypothetical protein K2M27_11065 [Muribaculaceae bacterium]|nr:hypothetical protein [Muribaculaceae bacterium]